MSLLEALVGIAVAVSQTVATPALAEPDGSCADALDIEASAEDLAALRESLEAGMLGAAGLDPCQGYSLRLSRDAGGLSLLLVGGERSISRRVSSLEHAAMWVETWLASAELAPDTSTAQPPSTPAVALSAVGEEDQVFPDEAPPRHRVETRVEALGVVTLTGEPFVWGGPEVAVTALLTPAFWLGGSVGLSFSTANVPDELLRFNDDTPTVGVALRGGWRRSLNTRLSLDLGGGLGVTVDTELDQRVNPFAELMANLTVALARRFSLVAGLLGRAHFLAGALRAVPETRTSPNPPAATGFLAGELRVGFAYAFGGT